MTRNVLAFSLFTVPSLWLAPKLAAAQQPLLSATVGSGADESYLVLDFANGTGTTADQSYAFGYRYDPATTPTGYSMIQALAGANIGFGDTSTYYNESFGSGYVIDSFTYNGLTETEPADYSSYWDYYTSNSPQFSYPDSSIGVSARTLTDGSYDGWVFDQNGATPLPTTPMAASAAPEPSEYGLIGLIALGLGGAIVQKRRVRVA